MQVRQVSHFLSRERVILLSLLLFILHPSLNSLGKSVTVVEASDLSWEVVYVQLFKFDTELSLTF